jgi:hypothetical protein
MPVRRSASIRDAERLTGIPPETGGTSIIDHDFIYQTV